MGNLYLYTHFYKVNEIDRLSQLKDYDKTVVNDIKSIEKHLEKLKAYQKELFDRYQELLEMKYKNVVQLQRRDYGTVTFYLACYTTPVEENVTDPKKFYHHKRVEDLIKTEVYKGKERHIAIKRAEALAQEYNAIYIHNLN